MDLLSLEKPRKEGQGSNQHYTRSRKDMQETGFKLAAKKT